jgi:hypothetical protein
MSDLEKFVRKNREDFDNTAPSGRLWDKIDQSLSPKKQIRTFSLRDVYKWSAAAAIFFIILTSAYFIIISNKNSHEEPVVNREQPTQPVDIGSIAPEYAAEFHQLSQSVTRRQQELKSAASMQPQLYQQFQEDMNALDSSYLLLKKQVEASPNRDVIIRAMIQNLQLQAELLARQLMIFNQFKNTKKTNNEINS